MTLVILGPNQATEVATTSPQFNIDRVVRLRNTLYEFVCEQKPHDGIKREVKSNSPTPGAMETETERNIDCGKSLITSLVKKKTYLNVRESLPPRVVSGPGHSCADRFFGVEQCHSDP
jgi:hypothetical protein